MVSSATGDPGIAEQLRHMLWKGEVKGVSNFLYS